MLSCLNPLQKGHGFCDAEQYDIHPTVKFNNCIKTHERGYSLPEEIPLCISRISLLPLLISHPVFAFGCVSCILRSKRNLTPYIYSWLLFRHCSWVALTVFLLSSHFFTPSSWAGCRTLRKSTKISKHSFNAYYSWAMMWFISPCLQQFNQTTKKGRKLMNSSCC